MGNLRGVIAPIVDLKLNFGLANAALDGTTELNGWGVKGWTRRLPSTLKNKAEATKVAKKLSAAGSE